MYKFKFKSFSYDSLTHSLTLPVNLPAVVGPHQAGVQLLRLEEGHAHVVGRGHGGAVCQSEGGTRRGCWHYALGEWGVKRGAT